MLSYQKWIDCASFLRLVLLFVLSSFFFSIVDFEKVYKGSRTYVRAHARSN